MIYVVFVVVLLSLFAAGIGSQALFAFDLSDRLSEQLRASYLAKGAVQIAVLALAQDANPASDGLNDVWADNPELFRNHPLAGGWFSVGGDTAAPYGFVDEERRINLNTAPEEVLTRLLQVVGGLRQDEAQIAAESIEDWRDADDDQRPHGAEGFYYRSLRHAYDCKDGPFENIEELLLVRGISPAAYHLIEPYVTVFGSGRLNLNTASPTVLQLLGLSQQGVEGLRAYRSGEDSQEGTQDDRPLSVSGLQMELERYVPIEDLARLSALAQGGFLGTTSEAFRLSIRAHTPHPASGMRVACIMDRHGTIRQWTEQ